MIRSTYCEEVLQITLCKYPEVPPGSFVCAYLVDGLLVDTGPAHTAAELTDFLKDKNLRMAVNTHHHEDHIAANKFLQDRFGIDIFAHPLSVKKINRPADLYPYQVDVWGYPVPSEVKPLSGPIRTDSHELEVINTPGHDRDHICLFDSGNDWLFSGDLFLGARPTCCRPMEDGWQIIEDLKQVRSLKPRIIFSAPGSILVDPIKKLDAVIGAMEDVGERVRQLHLKGVTEQGIMKQIFGNESPMAERTQHQFSSLNLIKSFLGKFSPEN